MPKSLGGHACPGLDASCWECSGVGEGDQLLNTRTAAATTVHDCRAEHGLWVDIELNHTNTISGLVGVHRVPLSLGDGALPVPSTHIVCDLTLNNDTAIVTSCRGGQSRKSNTGLRHEDDLVGNAIAVQPRSG